MFFSSLPEGFPRIAGPLNRLFFVRRREKGEYFQNSAAACKSMLLKERGLRGKLPNRPPYKKSHDEGFTMAK